MLRSVGCILYELISGKVLFSAEEDFEHLVGIERVLNRDTPQKLFRHAHKEALDAFCVKSSKKGEDGKERWRLAFPERGSRRLQKKVQGTTKKIL